MQFQLLSEVYKLSDSCSVELPNGLTSAVLYTGKYAIGQGINLENVFFVPEFKCNLISISKITEGWGLGVSRFCLLINDVFLRT